jgi:hypothetical protein
MLLPVWLGAGGPCNRASSSAPRHRLQLALHECLRAAAQALPYLSLLCVRLPDPRRRLVWEIVAATIPCFRRTGFSQRLLVWRLHRLFRSARSRQSTTMQLELAMAEMATHLHGRTRCGRTGQVPLPALPQPMLLPLEYSPRPAVQSRLRHHCTVQATSDPLLPTRLQQPMTWSLARTPCGQQRASSLRQGGG